MSKRRYLLSAEALSSRSSCKVLRLDVASCTIKRVLEAKPAGGHTLGEINSPDTRVDVKPKLFRTGVRLPPPPPIKPNVDML